MNRPQLIQEIIAGGFAQYEQAGLIDHQSLNRWIRIELKRFGSNVMMGNEATLEVKNGKAKLPENFWKLDLALRVELVGIEGKGDQEDFLQSRIFYKERNEVDVKWDNESYAWEYDNFKCVTEDIYFPNYQIRKRYENGKYLRLTKGFNREKVSSKCHNLSQLYTNSAEHEINITEGYINTNFPDGYIYIQFSGLELDEQKELIIPECNNDRISEYLITYCRKRTLEDIIMGDDDPNKINMLNYYVGKEKNDFALAMSDAAWHGAQGWKNAMKKKTAQRMLQYENTLPNK